MYLVASIKALIYKYYQICEIGTVKLWKLIFWFKEKKMFFNKLNYEK